MAVTRMRALKSFRGAPDEGDDPKNRGNVRKGREFDCSSVQRAREYERTGLAEPVGAIPEDDGADGAYPTQPVPLDDDPGKEERLKQEQLGRRAGGGTGEVHRQSSSRQAPRQPARGSRSKR